MAASALIILGCALAVGAAIAAVVRIRFLMRCEYAVARVTETSAQEEESGEYRMMQTYYRSSLVFETGEGRTVSFRHDHGTRNPGVSVGDTLPVRYRAENPSESAEVRSIVNEIMIWTMIIVPAVLGAAFIFAGFRIMQT